MNLDTITTVNDSLQQIQEVTYSWDNDGLGDEDVYKACDELRSVHVCILTTLDELLDEDKDGDGDSKDDFFDEDFAGESVIAETAGEKAARTARECANSILDRVRHSPISPAELLSNLELETYETRRKVEDDGFVKLYRGYSVSTDYDWNASFHFYTSHLRSYANFMSSCQELGDISLQDRLKRRNEILVSAQRIADGGSLLSLILLRQLEAIKFATDWKIIGQQHGESSKSPPQKKPRINFPSNLNDQVTLHMRAHISTALFRSKAMMLSYTRDEQIGVQRLNLTTVIAELKSNCDSRLAHLADSSVLTLGGLFLFVLDSTEECSENPWEDILNHEFFDRLGSQAEDLMVEEEVSYAATLRSWDTVYEGDVAQAVICYVTRRHMDDTKREYAKYIFIILSSGMGKSRMIDEVSKTKFTIPLCLRSGITGFPAPDTEVRDFLTRKCNETSATTRVHAFLAALFGRTTVWVEEQTSSIENIAQHFRLYMTQNQKQNEANANRIKFYHEVVEIAAWYTDNVNVQTPDDASMSLVPDRHDRIPAKQAERLTQALLKYALGATMQPLILLSFEESHTLTVAVENTTDEEKPKPTYFMCLRQDLRALIKHSVFSFFLSTTGKVFQFTLTPQKDPSSRGQEGCLLPIPPYSDIGFDQLALKVCENMLKIEDVAKVEFMVKLGQPLFGARYEHGDDMIKDHIVDFAAEKLLNQTLDENQLLSADQNVAPSEPIIGEAARMIMKRPDFKPANALLTEFRQPEIERGPRGEVTMMLMVIIASDMIAKPGEPFLVTDFMSALFGAPSTAPDKTFADAKMYFNHFMKVADYQVINHDYLWHMILRGVVIVCANNQAGVDFIIPFCYSDKELGRANVSGMFWQIKNDARFGGNPHAYLFDAMDPYKLGTYNDQDEDAKTGGLPIIRVVAALASKAKDPKEKNPKKEDSKEEAEQTELWSRRAPRTEGSSTKKKGKGKEKAMPKKQRSPRYGG
ncbi:hypothetical protein PILCRDRAFT_9111 [Piloderma croceum F 1598]|uniref:Uncharacterized protein n=1 Tax=Piloderma croceum (strain F 1598) TaxID=765440 RepID=A0A0C3B4E4_PILCF|nr:hypothetical protein PILCRDRAFT_9111 [Piloderma croceum F 1598]